jgi:hypothetical protein
MWNLGLLGAMGARIGDFELITSTILTSNEPSVTFNNLDVWSSTYKHLQIRGVARTAIANTADTMILRVNGNNSSANYRSHSLVGVGSGVVSEDYNALTGLFAGQPTGANQTANIFEPLVIDILDAYSTTKNKTMRRFSGTPATPRVWLVSGLWISTNIITSLEFLSTSANLVTGTRFSIYGIKG